MREGGFYPSALEKGSRTDQAVNLMMAEMYVQGVSTRKVIEVLQRLIGPAPKGHLFRHPDGFVCLRLDSPEPSRAHLRVVDESYGPDPIPEEPSEYPRF